MTTGSKPGEARLALKDWRGGEKLWLVDVVAPFGGHDPMIADLEEKVFAEHQSLSLSIINGKPEGRSL